MADYSLGFILDNIWIICFLTAGLYNVYFRREYKPIIHLSFVIAGALGVSKIVYTQIILPEPNLREIYYLYWAGASLLTVGIVSIDHQIKGYAFHWPVKLAISLFLIEILLNLAVHLDRNVVALNGMLSPNQNLENAWWLWGVRNTFLYLDNLLIIASLVFPYKAFKGVDDIYKHKYGSSEMDRAFKRVELLENIMHIMPNSLKKAHAYQCVESARFLLEQWDSQGEDRRHLYSANTLCDRARYLAFTSDDVSMEKLEEFDGVPKVDYR